MQSRLCIILYGSMHLYRKASGPVCVCVWREDLPPPPHPIPVVSQQRRLGIGLPSFSIEPADPTESGSRSESET